MREILFRGKRIDNGEWVEGYIYPAIGLDKGKWLLTVVDDMLTTSMTYEIDPSTICQYTGLTDKNGQKIWENDIVAFTDMYSTESGYAEMDCIGKVGWDSEELCFYVTERLSAESWEVLQECYVIGNIFDNPELMEGERC